MPEARRSGFLSGYAGNPAQRTGRWLVDRLLPGNQRAADGTLENSAVWKGLAVRGAGLAANALLPGSGMLVNQAGKNYINTGNVLPPKLQQLMGDTPNVGRLSMMQFDPSGQIVVPNVNGSMGGITTLPSVQAETPWTGSLTDNNPFGGQYGGNLGMPSSAPRVSYGNGAGAGTGYGATSYANDRWGDAASGFGAGNNRPRDPGLPAVYNERPLPKWMR